MFFCHKGRGRAGTPAVRLGFPAKLLIEMHVMTIARKFSAAALINAREDAAWDGNPPWLNVVFSPKPGLDRSALVGSGLYAIFLDGWLLYIGRFVGPEQDPFGGSVLTSRWLRHVGTLTMRGKQVSIRQNARRVLDGGDLGVPLADVREAAAKPGAALLDGQGMEMSSRKMEFAASRWSLFSGPFHQTLGRIDFGYARLDPMRRPDWPTRSAVIRLLEPVEKALVAHYEPPLNTGHNPTPRAAHAHADTVMEEIERRLLAALRGAAWQASPAAAAAAIPGAVPADGGEESEDPFSGKLPDDAEVFFEAFATAVKGAGRLFLYYTHGGDEARVATARGGVRRRPFLILEWCKRGGNAGKFKARSRLPIGEVKRFGFDASPSEDTQMPSEFPVDPAGDRTGENLLALCERASELDL